MLRKLVGLATAVAFTLTGSLGARAQEDDSAAGSDEEIERVEGLFEREPVVYQITFPRFQTIVTPSFLLDAFFDMHANHWSHGQTNYAFGGEFIIRRIEQFDLVFSVDWADIRTKDDWWLESDKELVDADWGENRLSILTVDAAINWITELKEFWQIYYGVGLGIGIVISEFLKTDVDEQCIRDGGADPFTSTETQIIRANCFDENGNPRLDPTASPVEEDRVPPVIPALSFNVGSRWIIDDDWAIQLELGFKNIYLYAGLEFGYIWE